MKSAVFVVTVVVGLALAPVLVLPVGFLFVEHQPEVALEEVYSPAA